MPVAATGKPMTNLPGAMYWLLAVALLVFGFVAMFSVGAPFFALGLALIILAPFRDRSTIFWPPIGGVIAFFAGYVLVAPLRCTARGVASETIENGGSVGSESTGSTACTNLLGIDYSGSGTYNPPLWPALIAGLAAAAAVILVVRVLVSRAAERDARQRA